MPRIWPPSLERILDRLGSLAAPRHRDLVNAMRAELASITDPVERWRFALGAIAAIARLSLRRYTGSPAAASGSLVPVSTPPSHATPRSPAMPELSARELLRRHVAPFLVTFGLLSAFLLARTAERLWPQVSVREDAAATLLEALLLAIPSTVALTIPMAVFIAVGWVFAGLGREGVLGRAARERRGIRRLVRPVVGATAVIAALLLVSNIELLPRANSRYTALLSGHPVAPYDRAMTLGELREAARTARAEGGADAASRAAAYEVEIQKKFALAAASLFLALAAAAVALRFPRAGRALVLVAGTAIFMGYYVTIIAGEALADQLVLSPVVAMWMGNAVLLGLALLLVGRRGGGGSSLKGPLAVEGVTG